MNPATDELLFTYYGDDFTGSTDVLESLTAHGVPTALFLEPPTPEQVLAFRLIRPPAGQDGRLKAFGVAGLSRTMSPAQMRATLPEVFNRIAAHPSRFFHYKVCSTFDSAPEIGNLGVATDLALDAFPSSWVPLVVAAPALGRCCAFGNLFAQAGGTMHRLDRHPTMARHPITPMTESDLRRHLAAMTSRRVDLIDLRTLGCPTAEASETLRRLARDSAFVLFDAVEDRHLLVVGELICTHVMAKPQLIVGSSGVQAAVCGYLAGHGGLPRMQPSTEPLGSARRVIAIAGSAAPGTARQIECALDLGFTDIRLDTVAVLDRATRDHEINRVVAAAVQSVRQDRSPLVYAARGPEDPNLARTNVRASGGTGVGPRAGTVIAAAQGEILRRLLADVGPQRVVVAGGDTSGFAARALRIHALEMACPIAPGAPLCRAHVADPALRGLEIALKGGQNGNERYFESILRGEVL